MRLARLLVLGWMFNLKMLSRSAFDGLLGILYTLFFATVAFFMFRAGHDSKTLLYASPGAAVMGVWSSTSTSAGCRHAA
jgi:ABC-2 type transport system permease protein